MKIKTGIVHFSGLQCVVSPPHCPDHPHGGTETGSSQDKQPWHGLTVDSRTTEF